MPPFRTPPTAAPPPASVLTAARRAGPIFRDQLASATDLSHATVNRQVARLLDAGLLRERPDLGPSGAVGRPRVPVEVDPDTFGVLGLHLGRTRTTLAAADLRGRVLGAVEVPNPTGAPSDVLGALAGRLRRFGARWADRRVLHVGLVVGGRLSADRARLTHPRLGWDAVPVADISEYFPGADVAVAPQVEAMAGAESLLRRHPLRGTTLHVYARDAVGAALTVDGAVPASATGPGSISHLPVGSLSEFQDPCECGSTGCLEASVGDPAVAAAAHRAGIVPEPSVDQVVAAAEGGHRGAHELLLRRAGLLGRGVALARDVLNPDRVVLLGQAFTRYRPALDAVSAGFAAATVLEPMRPTVSALGPGVQALAACTTALAPVYADPLGVVRRGAARTAVTAAARTEASG